MQLTPFGFFIHRFNKALMLLGLSLIVLFVSSCSKDDQPAVNTKLHIIENDAGALENSQEALISMENTDTIEFLEGVYSLNLSLSVSDKEGIVIRGAGKDKTFLDFSTQISGAQGILATGMTNLIIMDLTVRDMVGDGIKVKDSYGVSLLRVGAEYTGEVSSDNGAYGLYPVTSEQVLIDDCYVRGASDAGIYVGQSEEVIVRNSLVEESVAGIEIENCIHADVYGNTSTHNTGGILIFDLPTLDVIPNGNTCRVFDNDIIENDHKNFAPSGNIVGTVPPGTGIMLLAATGIEIFDNRIDGNNVLGVGIVSYETLITIDSSNAYNDEDFDPWATDIFIHDNTFSRTNTYPSSPNQIGFLLTLVYPGGDMPDIVFDGADDPGLDPTENQFCISDNGSARFVDIDAVSLFENVNEDPLPYTCTKSPLPPVVSLAPTLP